MLKLGVVEGMIGVICAFRKTCTVCQIALGKLRESRLKLAAQIRSEECQEDEPWTAAMGFLLLSYSRFSLSADVALAIRARCSGDSFGHKMSIFVERTVINRCRNIPISLSHSVQDVLA